MKNSSTQTLEIIDFNNFAKISGKVRDSFDFGEKRVIVVSDRISAFDYILGTVPFKGQILNQISVWWFSQIDKIIPHHFISSPDPNISIVKTAKVLPVEIIVRRYLTGSTKTSAWYAYQNLNRKICGLEMPKGMKKNQSFLTPIITPTTKPPIGSNEHDEPISREKIISQNLVDEKTYKKIEEYSLKMFEIGEKIAEKNGLILVDTKYEFGFDLDGELMVIDEVHTPDSSRYWILENYAKKFANNEEPEMLDKEFVRRMVVGNGYDINSKDNPKIFFNEEIKQLASQKYIKLFEKITGQKFKLPLNLDIKNRITKSFEKIVKTKIREKN